MDRLTPAAHAHLHGLRLEPAHTQRVVEQAVAMACGEVEPEHIELGLVIEAARVESDLTSAA